jgi:predicted outer membrane repeat protein
MFAASPTRLARRMLPALLVGFYGCSDPSAPVTPRIDTRVHTTAAPVITVLNTDNEGPGSLRQAIADAASGSVIQFDASLAGKTIVVSGTGALGVFSKQLTIEGPLPAGITISGGLQSLVFGVANGGELTLRNLSVVDGWSGNGGGISILGGRVMLDHVLVANNEAAADGGGIAASDHAIVTIVNSTITGNVATSAGGGIYGSADFSIRNSTIANNGAVRGGGVFITDEGFVNVRNTIIANNVASAFPTSNNCFIGVPLSFIGQSLTNDDTCHDGPGMIMADPGLQPLADNGGPTKTLAITNSSAAVDAGADCSEATDQRYVARNQGLSCDIGAFEFNDFGKFTLTISPNVALNAKTGVATVAGTIACSKPGSATLTVGLRQTQKTKGKFTTIIEGSAAVTVATCGALPSSWSATITPTSGGFDNGTAASASVATSAYPMGFLPGSGGATVKLFNSK